MGGANQLITSLVWSVVILCSTGYLPKREYVDWCLISRLRCMNVKLTAMFVVQLLFLVCMTEVYCGVEVQCPAACICNTTEATCVDASLTEFPEGRFPSGLFKLDICMNNITRLDEYTIRKWMIVSLRQLNLSNNAINIINENALIAQSGLEKLDLSGNKLTNIPLKTFMYPPRLQWLSLARNREIQVAEDKPLLESDSLLVLHLEHCNIRKLSAVNFKKVVKLQELYLSHNKIESILTLTEGPVRSLMNIRILYISYNHLRQLPQEIISLPNLEKLDARNNELKMLCEMKYPNELCEGNFPTETNSDSVNSHLNRE
jgi:Leucine-rich repeat (LRR) protein